MELQYNVHDATGFTPFQIRETTTHRTSYILGTTKIETLDSTLSTREEFFTLQRENSQRAQENMKRQADSHGTDLEFNEGDCVYLMLQPFCQTSLAQ